MKNLLKYLVLFSICTFVMPGCDDSSSVDDPETDEELKDGDQVKWVYKLADLDPSAEAILYPSCPAFDDQNNAYYLFYADYSSKADLWVLALNDKGEKLWSNQFVSDNSSTIGGNEHQIICSDGKVLVVSEFKMRCYNAQNGNVLWTNDIDLLYWRSSVSVASGKVFFIDETEIYDHLKGVNLTDGTTICNIDLRKGSTQDIRGGITIIAGSKLFVSTSDIDRVDPWLTKILIWDIAAISNSATPSEYLLPEEYYWKGRMAVNSLGHVLFLMKEYNNSNWKLVSLNASGQTNWSVNLDVTDYGEPSEIYIDSNDQIFITSAYSDALLKLSDQGVRSWAKEYKNPSSFGNLQLLQNDQFVGIQGDPISGEIISYFSTFSLNNGKELSSRSLEYPYLLKEGNSISISNENEERETDNLNCGEGRRVVDRTGRIHSISRNEIFCIGDWNKPLQASAWSKVFGNYANTNAR